MAHSAASNLKRVVTQRGKNSLEIERDKFESGQVIEMPLYRSFVFYSRLCQ